MRSQFIITLAMVGTAVFAAPIAQLPPAPPPAPAPPPVPAPPPAPAPPLASLSASPVTNPQVAPGTKSNTLIKTGVADKRVNAALGELKISLDVLDRSVIAIEPGNPASMGLLVRSAEELDAKLTESIVKIDSAGTTDLAGAVAIKENAGSMLVLLNRVADDLLIQKPAIVANNAAPVIAQMLKSQNIKVDQLKTVVVKALPSVARSAAQEEIIKAGNPLVKVIVAYSTPV